MICTKCKQVLVQGTNFCPWCGKKISTTQQKRRAKSRGNGTGCAYYDKKHKYWVAQMVEGYREPKDLSKQRIPIKRTKGGFKRREDALAYCLNVKAERENPKPIDKTLQELFDIWEPWYSPRVDDSTLGCYRAAFAHFKPLHNKIVRKITAGELQQCMDDCKLGHRTHQNMKCTAGLLWAYAVDYNYADRDVSEHLYIGKGYSVQREPLTDEEIESIRQQIGKIRYADYLYALVYLGFRPGEFLEIRKDQVFEHDSTLFITEGKKTAAGRNRPVPVHKNIENIIRDRLYIPGTDLLFPMYYFRKKKEPCFGEFRKMSDEYLNKHVFKPMIEKLNISGNKVPYSARHSFSDKLKKAEGTDKVKASLIGHSDYSFTQKKYQSTNLDELKTTMDSIE